MADTLTTVYELTKPEVGASANSWGGKLNSTADTLDLVVAVPRVQRTSPVVGATTTIAVNGATVHKFTVSQVTTIVLSGWATDTTPGKWAQRVWLHITNGAAFAVTWPGAITWLAGAAPVLKTSGVDIIELFTVDNGVTVYGAHYGVVETGRIATAMLADDAVTAAKVADGAIDAAAQVVDGVLTPAKHDLTAWGRVRAYRTANLSVATGAFQVIPFDAEEYDVGNLHDPVTNNSRITLPATGLWLLLAQVSVSDDVAGFFSMKLRKGGVTDVAQAELWVLDNTGEQTTGTIAYVVANPNDYFELLAHAQSSSQSLIGGLTWTSFTAVRLA